jgi:hypothetical protein
MKCPNRAEPEESPGVRRRAVRASRCLGRSWLPAAAAPRVERAERVGRVRWHLEQPGRPVPAPAAAPNG